MTDKSKPAEQGRQDRRGGEAITRADAAACASDPFASVLGNLRRSLGCTADEIRESQRLLAHSFGAITRQFVRVHAIAAAGEGSSAVPGELRVLVDAMSVELQIEDTLNQLLGRALNRVDSMAAALNHVGSMVQCGCAAQEQGGCNDDVLATLAQSLEALGNAEHARGGHRFDAGPGSIDLF